MSVVRKIAKNTFWLFIADVVSKISLFLIAVFIARKLGDAEFGKYSFAITFSFFFTLIADMGLSGLLLRDVAKDNKVTQKYFNNILSIKFILLATSFILLFVLINIMGYPAATKRIVYIIGLSLLLNSAAYLVRYVFEAHQNMKYEAILSVTEKTVLTALCLYALFFGYGLFWISLVFLFTSIVNLVISLLLYIKKFHSIRLGFDFELWKYMIKEAWPMGLSMFFLVIYFKISIVILSLMKGDSVVGWYNASFQIIEGLIFIPIIFMAAVYPVMVGSFVKSKELMRIICMKSYKYLLIIVLPIIIILFFLSKRLILYIYGSQYANSILTLQILAFSLIFLFVVRVMGYPLVIINKQKLDAFTVFLGCIINISLNFLLIPIYGLLGAAVTTLISEACVFFIYYYFVRKNLFSLNIFRISIKPVIASLIMAIVIYLMKDYHLIFSIICSIAVYILFILLLGVFKKEDIMFFKELMSVKIIS